MIIDETRGPYRVLAKFGEGGIGEARLLMIRPVIDEKARTSVRVVLNWFEELKSKVGRWCRGSVFAALLAEPQRHWNEG